MPHKTPHLKLFPGSLPHHCPCGRRWRKNTARVKHTSKNQTPNPVKRNVLHLQKFGKFLCTLGAAVKRCHSSGSALPPPWQKGSGETRTCSSAGNSVKSGSARMTAMVSLGCPWQPLSDRWDDEMRDPEIGLQATLNHFSSWALSPTNTASLSDPSKWQQPLHNKKGTIVSPFPQLALVPAHKPNPQGPGTCYSQHSTAGQVFNCVQGSECWAVLISLLLCAQK